MKGLADNRSHLLLPALAMKGVQSWFSYIHVPERWKKSLGPGQLFIKSHVKCEQIGTLGLEWPTE